MNSNTVPDPSLLREVQRRRTFAIISHPDAGKTTLTEKLLLYGGRLDVAGAVRGRKTQRAATSDWMEIERQRGISISSAVLSFEYQGAQINLLDTPGHEDFSEDTYRTLVAADSAVMVVDLAKGIEAQTEKLFHVCARSKLPVLTFVNKVDRPGRHPLEVLDEIERKFGIVPVPMNWPIGSGHDFSGLCQVHSQTVSIYKRGESGDRILQPRTCTLSEFAGEASTADARQLEDDIELIRTAAPQFNSDAYLAGEQTPVFFGSALNNYGLDQLLEALIELSPAPAGRLSDRGIIPAHRPEFSAFVFKIQANLDPRHRDRIAFVRVCSGRFEREMEVFHPRSGKRIKLPRSHRLFAQDRETIDVAYPGDIIGLVSPGEFRLGDTICVGEPFQFAPLPQFTPEHFAVLRCRDTARRKQFGRGLEQLVEEGAIQVFQYPDARQREPILAAVGSLQFEVVQYRLESEYGVATNIEWLPFKIARWLPPHADAFQPTSTARRVLDRHGRAVVLFQSQWDADYCARQNSEFELLTIEHVPCPSSADARLSLTW